MSLEEKVQGLFKKVLDISSDEIVPDQRLDESLDMDSTEMVEISVGLKKELGVEIADNEIKKSHTFNEIIAILQSKGAS